MVASRLIVFRKRNFHFVDCSADHKPLWGHIYEYAVSVVYLLSAIIELAGCFGFYEGVSTKYYRAACWSFIIPSLVCLFIGLYTFVDIFAHREEDIEGDEGRTVAGHGAWRREFVSNVSFVLAQLFFAVGCILFLPEVDHLKDGTTLFCIGSGGFVISAFLNTVNMTEPPKGQNWLIPKLSVISLGLGEIGGCLFVTGSFFFFPQLVDGTCSVKDSWHPDDVGTNLFVAGCTVYLLAALLDLYKTYLSHMHPYEPGYTPPEAVGATTSKTAIDMVPDAPAPALANRECC